MTSDEIIALLGLEPHPDEGGMWAQTWLDEHGSGIYFLIRPDDFSAMHRLSSPEIWHHYLGDPVSMLLLQPGGAVEHPVLGKDLTNRQRPCLPVPGGVWMGASTLGEWSLVGTTMAPAWSPDGFELGDRSSLTARYPQAAHRIAQLTRA
jgi:hypothetical protein